MVKTGLRAKRAPGYLRGQKSDRRVYQARVWPRGASPRMDREAKEGLDCGGEKAAIRHLRAKSISALGSKVSGGQTTEQSLPDYIGCFEEEFNLAWSRQIIQALPNEDTGVFCRLTRKSGTSQETQTSAKDELMKLLEMMKSEIAEQQRQYEVLRRTNTKQSSKSSDRDSLDGAATPIWLEFTGKGPSASEYPTDHFTDSSMEAS